MTRLAAVLRDVWRHATYRDTDRPHPRAAAGMARMRTRRSQDDLEGWR